MPKFNAWSYEFVLASAFMILILASVISYLNPLEKIKQYRDTKLEQDTNTLSRALKSFKDEKGKLPWSDDAGGDNPYPPLKWSKISSILVGVCNNEICSEPGDLIKSKNLGGDFMLRASVKTSNPQDTIYIGKGPNKQDNIYICFLPHSAVKREDLLKLYDIDLNEKTSPTAIQTACSDNTAWHEKDVCYQCIVN